MLNEILKFKGVTSISKKQQKFVTGGLIPSGTCAVQGGNGYSGVSGVSREYAENAASVTGGHWCCDSCGSVGWLPQDHKDYLSDMR